MRLPFRARPAALGVAVSPTRVTAVAAHGGARWTRPLPADGEGPLAAATLRDTIAALLREAREAMGAGRARVWIALLPPLGDSRFVSLPGLYDDEVERVLARDAASWFPVGATPHVVAAAPRRAIRGSALVLAGAVRADLADAVHTGATAAGCTVEAIVPAHAAWARAAGHAWRLPDDGACTLVVALEARVDVLTLRGGRLVALRRVPAAPDHRFVLSALEEPAAGANGQPGIERARTPVAVLGDGAAAAAISDALAAAGVRLLAPSRESSAFAADVLAAAAVPWIAGAPQLLPERSRAERRQSLLRAAARRAVAATLLLAAAAAAALLGAQRELRAVAAERAALRPSLAGVLATRDTVALIAERLAMLRRAEAGTRRWSHAVGMIAASLPRDAHLLALRGEGDSLVIEGVARRVAPVFDALGRHPSVLSVRAQGSIRQEIREEEGQVERFTLVVRLARGAVAAGGAP